MSNQNILVTALETDDESFARALGIDAEREDELSTIADKCYSDTETYPDAIAMISEQLQNANELAYTSFLLGVYSEQLNIKSKIERWLTEK